MAEAGVRKSQSVINQAQSEDKPQADRMRQVLVDYANALTILDWRADQQSKREHPEDWLTAADATSPTKLVEARAAAKAEADTELDAAFAEYKAQYGDPRESLRLTRADADV